MNSQSYYQVNTTGIGNVQLNTDIRNYKELHPLNKGEKSEYIFRPAEDDFASLNLTEAPYRGLPFIIKNAFIAYDSTDRIRKIILFFDGNKNGIIQYLDEKLQVTSVSVQVQNSANTGRTGYLWHTDDETTISMVDLSDLYRISHFMIEIISNDTPQDSMYYSVIKSL